MDLTELSKQLKNKQPAPVYLVLGTQQALIEQALDQFLQLIPEEERVMNVGRYDMETTPVAVALDDAMAAPFFGERRLVVINKPYFLTGEKKRGKIDHDVDGLKDYLSHPEMSTIFVILAPYEKLDGRKGVVKALKKTAVTVSAAPLNEQQARQAIVGQLMAANFQIDQDAVDELVQRTNADYGLMEANLAKLKILAYQDQHITRQMVAELVPQSLDENVFDLVTAVLKHDQVRALDLYRQLLAGQQQPLRINAVLVGQFRLLLQLKVLNQRGLSQGSLAKELNVHPYRVKLGLRTVRNFSTLSLENAYLGLIRIEQALKTTQRDPALLFQLFMLQYAHQARLAN
ncbi:DNA polymerase III subunit delta [Limosilactobacillus sp.]|jgi:DNA polymerase-3 subunit delta|uniref:DNA polymerase III subunit delta n=1 Tax=Limosilactobacillus sp. TaxID=2773925 RepID=UPI0025B8911F|nr:DNA polymerase III subunit delta [Limosilactobacillus sp.]MCH3922550.1 DNA polymerase III subunit delta [Limosilactobacillus sp.]MCH3927232.1 DNA polymerase III subunit delta [Limosilactobacillus sp.]